jgi:hypothetical protein
MRENTGRVLEIGAINRRNWPDFWYEEKRPFAVSAKQRKGFREGVRGKSLLSK